MVTLRTICFAFLGLGLSLAAARGAGPCEQTYHQLSHQDRMERAADQAGLHYREAGEGPSLRRVRTGKTFTYQNPDGTPITDPATLERLNQLAIPPGYRDVWISTDPLAHIQATAVDARGRVQYRYHPRWIEFQSRAKFARIREFGQALPQMREAVARDLAGEESSRDRVMAGVVRLLERTQIRIGNEEYAAANGHFGLTTLRKEHVRIQGSRVTLNFVGKAGVPHEVVVNDPDVSRLLRGLMRMPGENLFQYLGEGGVARAVDSADVNDYIRRVSGGQFTAKDFRTWGGSVTAARSLLAPGNGATEARVRAAVVAASEQLGNTPSVARENYIFPEILSAYERGDPIFTQRPRNRLPGFTREENVVLELLGRP